MMHGYTNIKLCFHVRFATVVSTLEVPACLTEQNDVILAELLFNP